MLYSCVKFERDRTIGVREIGRTNLGGKKEKNNNNKWHCVGMPTQKSPKQAGGSGHFETVVIGKFSKWERISFGDALYVC